VLLSPETVVDPALDFATAVRVRSFEAHVESEIARSADEAKRLTALRRALDECDGGSERDAMRVFADAVSIWEDCSTRTRIRRAP